MWYTRVLRSIFPGFYGLLNYITIRLLQDSGSGFHFWERPWPTTASEIAISFIVGYIVVEVINRLCLSTDKKLAGQTISPALVRRELLYLIGLNALIVNIVLVPFTALTDDGLSVNDFATINIVPLLFTIIYYGGIRSNSYLKAYIQNQLLVEKLTNDQLQTELKFLKAQYHPHFLFNALNTIYFRMDEDVPGAKRNVEQLSELLRYQLYDQQQQVSLSQEMDYLRNYIELQKTRAHQNLQMTIELDNGLQSQQVYPLLFLPLVENAFKYVGGGYQLSIKANSTGNGLLFKVINSVHDIALPKLENSGGIGSDNLNRRLQLLYPGKHKLTTTTQGGYYTAQLELIF